MTQYCLRPGANREHGVRWTNADKRRAVLALLADPEWVQWSDAAIARHVGVTDKTIARYRRELIGKGAGGDLGNSEVMRRYRSRHGSVAKMHLGPRKGDRGLERRGVPHEPAGRQVGDQKHTLAIGDHHVSDSTVKPGHMPKSIGLSKETDLGRVQSAMPVDPLASLAKAIEVVLALGLDGLHCQDDAELASLADATAALLEMLRSAPASRH